MVKEKLGQPVLSIGLIGHVDHGKTTLLQRLSGVWADTHSEEVKRGITIRLGYADTVFYKCPKCKGYEAYTTGDICPKCKSVCEPLKKVSFVDAPGHETLMATMLSGAAIMDGALLLVAANEKCPQPQTKEHLMALNLAGIKEIVVVQNKIDLISEEQVLENYKQIKKFLKGTTAENAPIIPISAQHNVNIDLLIETIVNTIKLKKRDLKKDPLLLIVRSFDINKPGTNLKKLIGGVLGGALRQGILKKGDEIEVKPGLRKERDNKFIFQSVKTKIISLRSGGEELDQVIPGGNIGLLTDLDPSIVKTDQLTGNLVGLPGKLPEIREEIRLEINLLERVVGSKKELEVENIKMNEVLMFNINGAATVGTVYEVKKNSIKLRLKIPVCADIGDKVAIARRVENRWRLIGVGEIK